MSQLLEELRILIRKLSWDDLPADSRERVAGNALAIVDGLEAAPTEAGPDVIEGPAHISPGWKPAWARPDFSAQEPEWCFEDARAYLDRCRRDFAKDYAETHDAASAMQAAYGSAPSNEDLLKLIWASGQVTEAFEAVREDVEQEILPDGFVEGE